jgi:hypothetical protein
MHTPVLQVPTSFPDRMTGVLRHAIRPLGFAGPRRTWIRNTGATVAVINLQRSSWSDLCYLNFGLLLNALGRPKTIREEHCHLRLRAPYPEPKPSLVEAALDPERSEIADSQRDSIIAAYLHRKVEPLLRRWESPEAIRQDLDSGALAGAAVTLRLRTFIQERDRS